MKMTVRNELVELIKDLSRGFIRFPGDLKVTWSTPAKRTLVIMLQGHADDTGKLIGESGAMIVAFREIAYQIGCKMDLKILVEVLEPVVGSKLHQDGYKLNPDYDAGPDMDVLHRIGKFLFGETARVENSEYSPGNTSLVLLIDDRFDYEPELVDALGVVFRARGFANGCKLSVDLDTL